MACRFVSALIAEVNPEVMDESVSPLKIVYETDSLPPDKPASTKTTVSTSPVVLVPAIEITSGELISRASDTVSVAPELVDCVYVVRFLDVDEMLTTFEATVAVQPNVERAESELIADLTLVAIE